eukprot:gb/GECH01006926.1/.p1 GENE.gb/GECH01006926.1/~~gb/GECH01006926.1/.p1  ORF type:complete len:160 (+),score=4.03 gb/GECH01006926.1/:1-480(+)
MPFVARHQIERISTFKQVYSHSLREYEDEFLQYFRSYQREAIQRVLSDRENQENAKLVVLPTGAGKTGVAVTLPYLLPSDKVLVITPVVSISNQIQTAFLVCIFNLTFFFWRNKILYYCIYPLLYVLLTCDLQKCTSGQGNKEMPFLLKAYLERSRGLF